MCGFLNNYVGVLVISLLVFTVFCIVCNVLLYCIIHVHFILIYTVCTSVRATATKLKLNCNSTSGGGGGNSSSSTYCFHLLVTMKMTTLFCTTCMRRIMCINLKIKIKVSHNTAQRLKRQEEMLDFHPRLDIRPN